MHVFPALSLMKLHTGSLKLIGRGGEFTPEKGADAAGRGSASPTSQLVLNTHQHPQDTVFPLGRCDVAAHDLCLNFFPHCT